MILRVRSSLPTPSWLGLAMSFFSGGLKQQGFAEAGRLYLGSLTARQRPELPLAGGAHRGSALFAVLFKVP